MQGKQQPSAPTTVFKSGDGFDLYVDAARFLPDNCAFAKVFSMHSFSCVALTVL